MKEGKKERRKEIKEMKWRNKETKNERKQKKGETAEKNLLPQFMKKRPPQFMDNTKGKLVGELVASSGGFPLIEGAEIARECDPTGKATHSILC